MRRTTALAIVSMALSLFAPAALIYVSKTQPVGTSAFHTGVGYGGYGDSGSKVWLTTPAFSIRDAEGENRLFVAALKMQDRVAATRMCRWMPIIRDRIQTVISSVDRRIAAYETPALSLEKRRLYNSLQRMLASAAPSQVAFVDAHVEPDTVLIGGQPALCDGNILNHRRSRMFTG